jgi:hypothetical protein
VELNILELHIILELYSNKVDGVDVLVQFNYEIKIINIIIVICYLFVVFSFISIILMMYFFLFIKS